jgi:DNA modification methylase
MGNNIPNAIVTDPPYGVGIKYNSIDDEYDEVLHIVTKFMRIALGYKCPTAITSGVRLLFKYPEPAWIMAWIHQAGNGMSPWGFTTFNPILIYGKDPYLTNGLGSRSDSLVLAADRGGENIHPVTKPLDVWAWLVERVSVSRDDIILDFFLGSGTTIVACEQTGRVGYGMEIAPEYVAVTLERLAGMGLQPIRAG